MNRGREARWRGRIGFVFQEIQKKKSYASVVGVGDPRVFV